MTGAATARQPASVYAAGSLRAPLTAIAAAFEQATGPPVMLTFGPSGLLRDRIVAGEPADMLASANVEHPEALVQGGWSAAVVHFARNELCALAHPRIGATPANVLAVLLDPRWKLGTSTPKADPSGDYAWDVFRRADAVKPGSFAVLSAKAKQLTGGPQSSPAPPNRSVYALLVADGEADVFLTYCTNAQQAIAEMPSLVSVRLPPELRVSAVYGLTVRKDAPAAARAFADHLASTEGQARLAAFGFAAP